MKCSKSKFAGALIALASLFTVPAQAASLVNAGFEDGNLNGWNASGDIYVDTCADHVMGCAPAGGSYAAYMNDLVLEANASLTQTILNGPGKYAFGAYVSFGKNDPSGNFSQGQVTIFLSGPNIGATLGASPSSLTGQFTIPGSLGYNFTPWILLTGTLVYAGPGDAPFLLNINIQDAPGIGKGLVLAVDNAFINAVPVPAALPLFAGGLGWLGWMARRRRSRDQVAE